jgi:hypothetical protein
MIRPSRNVEIACVSVWRFALVEPSLAAPTQLWFFKPVEHKQRAFNLANFLQRNVQLIMPFVTSAVNSY